MQTLYKEYASICEQVSATRTQELLEDFQKHYRLRIKDTIEGNVQNQIRNKFNEYYENVNQEYKPMNEKLEEVLHELSGTIPSIFWEITSSTGVRSLSSTAFSELQSTLSNLAIG